MAIQPHGCLRWDSQMGDPGKIGPKAEKHYLKAVWKELRRVGRMLYYQIKQTNSHTIHIPQSTQYCFSKFFATPHPPQASGNIFIEHEIH